ncbi:MAG: hypothetical protein IKN94_07955 [Salinivirgaceae bacterium]|nr:hypothetical protein [Salinivirgaceae bacterium]
MPDVNWRLRRPFHVCLHRRFWWVYKTDWVAPDGMGHSASPTEFYYSDRERAKAKAKELNDSYRLTIDNEQLKINNERLRR